jgi:hypothetical protein
MDSLIESRFARDPLCKFVVHHAPVDWDGWTVEAEPMVISKFSVRGYLATNTEGRVVLQPEPVAAPTESQAPNIDQYMVALDRVKALGSWEECKRAYAPMANKKKLTDPYSIVLRQVHNYVLRRRDPAKEARAFEQVAWAQVASAVLRAARAQ